MDGRRRQILWTAFLVYLVILLYSHRVSSLLYAGDSSDYIRASAHALSSLDFWTHRPLTISLVYRFFGSNPLPIVVFQVFFHAISWFALGHALMGWMRGRWMPWVALFILLAFSLSIEINLWTVAVLSESLSISTGVLALAVGFHWAAAIRRGDLAKALGWQWIVMLALSVSAWSFTRDAHPYVLVVGGAFLLAVVAFRPSAVVPRKWLAASGVLLVGIFLLQTWLFSRSPRHPWVYPITTNICQRILTDPVATGYFIRRGMVVTPTLASYAGRRNAYGINMVEDDRSDRRRDLAFEDWVDRHGMNAYLGYILSHPLEAARWVWSERREVLAPDYRKPLYGIPIGTLVYQTHDRQRQLIPPLCSKGLVNGDVLLTHQISQVFFPLTPWSAVWSLAAGMVVVIVRRRPRDGIVWLPLTLVALTAIESVVVVLGDANEVARHSLGATVTIRLAFWLAILFIADGLVNRQAPPLSEVRAGEAPKAVNHDVPAETMPWVWIACAYGLLLLLTFRHSSLAFGGDAWDYIQISESPLSLRFFSYRPFTIPLFFKAFGSNPLAIVMVQIALFASAWLLLARCVHSVLRSREGKWFAVYLLLVFSLSVEVNLWNYLLLSESIANSLTIMLLAAVFLLALKIRNENAKWTGGRTLWMALGGVMALGLLWSFARDAHPLVLLGVSIMLVLSCCASTFRRAFSPRAVLVILAFSSGVFFLQSWLTAQSDRVPWVYPMTNNICRRVLPNPEAKDYFVKRGMPDSQVLMRFSGKTTDYMGQKYGPERDPSQEDPAFDRWVESHGLRTYARFIMTHPMKALGWVWEDRAAIFSPIVRTDAMIGPFQVVFQIERRTRKLIPDLCSRGIAPGETGWTALISEMLFPKWSWFWAIGFLLPGAMLLIPRAFAPRWVAAILAGTCATAIALAITVFLGDCSEIGRHAITAVLLLRTALWIIVAILVDSAVAIFPKRRLAGARN